MLRVGLRLHPGLEVVGEADTLASALREAERVRPQAIVLDLRLPDSSPRQTYAAIQQGIPESTVVIFSARESSRAWYEKQGTRFFGKATDSLDALVDWLRDKAAGGA